MNVTGWMKMILTTKDTMDTKENKKQETKEMNVKRNK